MPRKRYSAEFKKEASALMIMEGLSAREVSEKLGVNPNMLYRWKRQHLQELAGDKLESPAASPQEMAAEIERLRKELAKSERINEILKKNGGLLCQGAVMKFRFIEQSLDTYEVSELCEALGVSRSAYYRWQEGEPSLRQQQDQRHKEAIMQLYEKSAGRYGHRPIYYHLLEQGVRCGRDRTLRLMKELELGKVQKKRYKPLGTVSGHDFGYSPNRIKELGQPTGCNQVLGGRYDLPCY